MGLYFYQWAIASGCTHVLPARLRQTPLKYDRDLAAGEILVQNLRGILTTFRR